jgi:hypothetical protein
MSPPDTRRELWNFISDLAVTHPLTEEESRRFHQLTNRLREEGVLPKIEKQHAPGGPR